VKIADFGLAKLLGQDAGDHLLTATHQVMGTLRYMAPEQMLGTREVDHRADIYSLGVIFYELLTGELPIGKFAPPSKKVQIDVRLDEIVLRALEQDPEQRYQHASEVKTDVEAIPNRKATTTLEEKMGAAFVGLPASVSSGRAPIAGLPETQVRFVVSDTSDVPRQANFHFSTLGYQLVEQRQDVCVFERGSKWAGLWAMDIRRLHTILTVRTAPAADGGLWVSCNWSIRKLGSWIPKSDIALLEEEGLGLQAVLNEKTRTGPGSWPPAGKVTPVIVSEPRVSRYAIGGAVWALFGLMSIAPAIWFTAWRPTPVPLPADGVTPYQIHVPWPVMLMGVISILGATAPLGATILGALAIGHIKRSGGRIIGLPLAVADVLFFPLFFLGCAVFALTHALQIAFWTKAHMGYVYRAGILIDSIAPSPAGRPDMIFLILDTLFALLVCFVIGRPVWRLLAGEKAEIGHPEAPTAKKSWRRPLPWMFAAILLVLACVVGLIPQNSPPSASHVPAVPALGTITSGIGASFTVPAGHVAIFEIVTRRDNATVPVPPHCGYVIASQDAPIEGIFRWKPEDAVGERDPRRWRFEFQTAGGGGGHTGGLLLPEGLDSAVGASGLGLGVLEPNEEVVHWGAGVDASNLPANGQIGLRVTVVPHNLNRSGSGIGHIDWKSPPLSSTTRRKLPQSAP
jgi:hypothetical protein